MCISAYFFVYTHQIFPTKLNPRSSDRGTKEAIALHTLWNSWKCFAFPADLFALFKTERVDRKQSRENIFQYPVYVSFLTNTRFNIHFLYNLHFFGMAFFFFPPLSPSFFLSFFFFFFFLFIFIFLCNSLSGVSAQCARIYIYTRRRRNQTGHTPIDHISA